MNARDLWILGIVLLIAVVGAWWYFGAQPAPSENGEQNENENSFDQSTSDGVITINYSDDEWGLAVNTTQILVDAVVPPCSDEFDYCFYRLAEEYVGTNFESAGVRILERTDLDTEESCLTTQPEGYSTLDPALATSTEYSVSLFAPLQDAGAGHFSEGELYRLSYGNACYEFETRIAQTQLANFPEGTVEEFTDSDRATLQARIDLLLENISLPSGIRPFAQ